MMKPIVKNAADPGQVKEAERKELRARERELDDMRKILSTEEGRRLIWRYLGACGVFKLSYRHSGSETVFLEGQRNVGLTLLGDVNEAAPEAYLVMMKEAKEGNL